MKNKYQRMTKEEKAATRMEYKKSERGQAQMPRLTRLLFIGGFGILYTGYLIITAMLDKASVWEYIYAILLGLASLIFIIGSLSIRAKEYNKYTINKNKKKT